MTSFELIKEIACCDECLKRYKVTLLNDISTNASTIGVELKTVERNTPLNFRINITSPPTKFEGGQTILKHLMQYNECVIENERHKLYVRLFNNNDNGVVEKMQVISLTCEIIVYERNR